MELYWIWGAVAVAGLWNWIESRETPPSDHSYEDDISVSEFTDDDEPLILDNEEIGVFSINENLQ